MQFYKKKEICPISLNVYASILSDEYLTEQAPIIYERKIRQQKYLKMTIKALVKLFISTEKIKVRYKKSYLKGLQFTLKGRLKGARRARKMSKHHGSIGPNTYNKRSKSNQQTIYTKWGTWNLKTSLSRTTNLPHRH